MADIEVLVREWYDFGHLLAAYDEVGAQRREVTDYVARWVCDREGFEPSPVCVLRPLAEGMDRIRQVFDDLGAEFDRRWAGHRDAVVESERRLRAAEQQVADRLRDLVTDVVREVA
jgi:hypothetical protein